MRYDHSVRNSENTVVQFTYGDDSLNPEKMENNDRPVEFDRMRLHISQMFPCPGEPPLLNDDLLGKIERALGELKLPRVPPCCEFRRKLARSLVRRESRLWELWQHLRRKACHGTFDPTRRPTPSRHGGLPCCKASGVAVVDERSDFGEKGVGPDQIAAVKCTSVILPEPVKLATIVSRTPSPLKWEGFKYR